MRQMLWLTLLLPGARSDFDQCLALNNKLQQSLEQQIRAVRAPRLAALASFAQLFLLGCFASFALHVSPLFDL